MKNGMLGLYEDLRQSENFRAYVESLGWMTDYFYNKQKIYIKKTLLGKVARAARIHMTDALDEVERISRQHKLLTCRIEPMSIQNMSEDNFAKIKYRPMQMTVIATKTLQIDIDKSDADILASFGRARSWINKLENSNNISVVKDDFELFYNIWCQSTRPRNLWHASKYDYEKMIAAFSQKVFCITIDNSCGIVILVHQNVAYYYYAATLKKAKEGSYPYLAVWRCMQQAKKMGCRTWDFDGIFDERYPVNEWLGFTQYKKTFGGQEVYFPGVYNKYWLRNLFCSN